MLANKIIFPILPELSLLASAVFILMADVFLAKRFKNFFRFNYSAAIIGVLISLYFALNTSTYPESFFNLFLFSNGFTVFVKIFLSILLLLIIVLALEYISKRKEMSAEFLSLIMFSTAGAMFLISSNDFLTLYLSLELQSLPLYLLAAMNRKSKDSSEGGIKYFILGSTASGILLLGISIFYGFCGTTNFDTAFNLYLQNEIPPAVVLGFVLIITAIFFKISAAPFHMWTPDVYQASHAVVTSFFATVSKYAATLVLVRIFLDLSTGFEGMNNVLILVAILSLTVGSFGAIMQKDLKRLFAYSSIGHIGFALFGLSAISLEAVSSCVIYMTIYAILSIGNFGFLTLITNNETEDAKDRERYKISNLSGLSSKSPILALSFAILMFSTAGIPPLAGFFSKFYVFNATIKQGYYISSIVAILFSVISAYYYLKIVKIMYFDKVEPKNDIKFYPRLAPKVVIASVALFNLAFVLYIKQFLIVISNAIGV